MKELLLILTLNGQLKDDDLHYLAGLNISNSVGSAYFVSKPYKPFRACLVGFIAGSVAGLGKELYDSRKGGTGFNKADLSTTVWGSLVGTLTLRIGIHQFYGQKRTIAYNILEN